MRNHVSHFEICKESLSVFGEFLTRFYDSPPAAQHVYPFYVDSKTDSRHDRQQEIPVDLGRIPIGLWSAWKTMGDMCRQVMPMERFEPSTLAGLVFETSAYTVPPHRLVA